MTKIFPKSPYEKIGGIVHFARMLDKIRLHQAAKLPADYVEYLGMPKGFDGRCCTFLQTDYHELCEQVKAGGSDEEILNWAFQKNRKPTEDEILIWNAFMTKRGWRDEAQERLQTRIKEAGFENRTPPIETFFDFIEADENRA